MPPKLTKPGPVPQEVISFFSSKGLKIGFSWYEVWNEEHQVSHTVAKILELNVLSYVKETIDSAIKEGTTFQEWRKNAKLMLDKSGWTNYSKSEKHEKHRLRIIYDTNMRTARATGQLQRIQRTKKVLPYLTYSLGPSVRHRPEHESWDGVTLPVDDPWWDSHFPPSAYGCKCSVRQIGMREVEQLGGLSERPPTHDVTWKLPDGREVKSPVGIHPSFNHRKGDRSAGLDEALKIAEEKKGA